MAEQILDIEKGIGKECKDYMVKDLARQFSEDRNLVITGYWGLGAEDMNLLRGSLKKVSSHYLIVKNSIAKRALEESKLKNLAKYIEGGVGIAFGGKDPINTIKALVDFSKKHNELEIRTGYLDGEVLDKSKIKQIAALPSRQELLTRLVMTMNAPISGFVNVLAGTLRSFIYVIQSYKDKKEKNQKEKP